MSIGCDLKVLKCSAGGVATRRARPIRFVRGLAAGPPQSRLAPAPEPLPSCASLRTGKLDSCRFVSSRTRPLTHALVAPSRPSAESTGIDGSRQESGCATKPAARTRTNRGDRASACDEVACVKTALGFNKKKPHPGRKLQYLSPCAFVCESV